MATVSSASQKEIQFYLRRLTSASRLEQFWRSRNVELRRKAEAAYKEADMWLLEHGVKSVYDKTQQCYVEEVSDAY